MWDQSLGIACLGAIAAAPALAAPDPCRLSDAASLATNVLQVESPSVLRDRPGRCVLVGSVVRVFRGHVPLGATVQGGFPCLPEGQEQMWEEFGQGGLYDPAFVESARYVELYGDGTDTLLALAVIDAVTERTVGAGASCD